MISMWRCRGNHGTPRRHESGDIPDPRPRRPMRGHGGPNTRRISSAVPYPQNVYTHHLPSQSRRPPKRYRMYPHRVDGVDLSHHDQILDGMTFRQWTHSGHVHTHTQTGDPWLHTPIDSSVPSVPGPPSSYTLECNNTPLEMRVTDTPPRDPVGWIHALPPQTRQGLTLLALPPTPTPRKSPLRRTQYPVLDPRRTLDALRGHYKTRRDHAPIARRRGF